MRRFVNADVYASTGQGFTGFDMFAYCGNNPVNKFDAIGMFPVSVLDVMETGASIVSEIANEISHDIDKFIRNCSVDDFVGGGCRAKLPSGLSSALETQSNMLYNVSSKAAGISSACKFASNVLIAVDVSAKIRDNLADDSLSLNRKVTDSIVDVAVSVGTVWGSGKIGAIVGSAVPIPVVGTAAGFAAGVVLGCIVEYTPIVSVTKDCMGFIADKAVGFFSKLFG